MGGLALKRGDVVRVAEGKPRPAVIVQSDQLATPDRILICPLTSELVEAPLYRPTVMPDGENNLTAMSQLMVDQIGPARRARIDGVIGRLSADDLARLTNALALVLAIGI